MNQSFFELLVEHLAQRDVVVRLELPHRIILQRVAVVALAIRRRARELVRADFFRDERVIRHAHVGLAAVVAGALEDECVRARVAKGQHGPELLAVDELQRGRAVAGGAAAHFRG